MAMDSVILLSFFGLPLIIFLLSLDVIEESAPIPGAPPRQKGVKRHDVGNRLGWKLGMAAAIVLVVLGFFWKPYDNIYEEFGVSPTARKIEMYEKYRMRLKEAEEESIAKKRVEFLFDNVLKELAYRKAYNRFGDYFHNSDYATINPPFPQVVGHSFVCLILCLCISLAFSYGRPSVVVQGSLLFLIACFCGDVYTRFVDANVMTYPFRLLGISLLPFEAIQSGRRIFPGFVGILLVVSDAYAMNKNAKLVSLVRSCLRSNAALYTSFKYMQENAVVVNPDLREGGKSEPAESEEDDEKRLKRSQMVEELADIGDEDLQAPGGIHKWIGAAFLLYALFMQAGEVAETEEL